MVTTHNMKPKGKFKQWARSMDTGKPIPDYSKEDFWYSSRYKRRPDQIKSIKRILSGEFRPYDPIGFNRHDTPQGSLYWRERQYGTEPFSQRDLAYLQYLLDNH